MRRVTAFAAVVAAVVALPGGVAGGPAACADENTFAIVVDFGSDPGAPSANTVTCVPVDSDDTAADALATRARMLGRPSPRYNNAGLLCSIDGFPEGGCGERTSAGYRYWSYWFGGDAWSYASTGPAFHRAKPGGVVGWRFQPAGTATASDPPPRSSARFAELCPPPAPAGRAPATRAAPSPATTAPPAGPAPTTPAEATAPTQADEPEPMTAAASTAGPTTTTSTVFEEGEFEVEAASGADGETTGDASSSWPVAVGGLGVAAALGGAAVVRARRR